MFILFPSYLCWWEPFQVGDPFALSPALHLILQFSIISVSATLYLVLSSIRSVLMAHERVKEEEEQCCSRPCSVIGLGVCAFCSIEQYFSCTRVNFLLNYPVLLAVLPAVLTFTTYYFANDYDSSLSRWASKTFASCQFFPCLSKKGSKLFKLHYSNELSNFGGAISGPTVGSPAVGPDMAPQNFRISFAEVPEVEGAVRLDSRPS